MIKTFYATEKTNSYRPNPWEWSTDPFPAFRGAGQRYTAFLAVANGFTPWFNSLNLADNKVMSDDYCKIIKTKKGGLLLVPCSKKEDERVLLITARGGYRGCFSKTEAIGAEILWENGMDMHCCPVKHIVARITKPDGYVRTETGRRCGLGDTEIYSWKGGYFRMPTEEYDAAVENGVLFANHNTIQGDLERCKAKRAEQAESRATKGKFLPRLEAVNATLEHYGKEALDLSDDTFFGEQGCKLLYNEETVSKTEQKVARQVQEIEERRIRERWAERFNQAVEGYAFPTGHRDWAERCKNLEFCVNCVSVWLASYSEPTRYDYSDEGLRQFTQDLPIHEGKYQSELRAEAQAEAERIAQEKAEEAERLAREEAAEKQAQAEVQAKELGLPSDVRIWKRRGGRTGCSQGWVIDANGVDRERDRLYNQNARRAERYGEGYEIWNQILPGELVIQWSKDYTAADHKFAVVHRPETMTEAQLERVAEIQAEIAEEWEGLTGLVSGEESPSIGKGWLGLLTA